MPKEMTAIRLVYPHPIATASTLQFIFRHGGFYFLTYRLDNQTGKKELKFLKENTKT
jgi:hypothetical protein